MESGSGPRQRWQIVPKAAPLGQQKHEVIDHAANGEPQVVTRYGKRVALIVLAHEFDRLSGAGATLWQYFRAAPTNGARLRIERDRSC